MAEYGQLQVDKRAPKGKGAVRQLRASGKIPAVLYGRGQDNVSIAIDPLAFRKATDPTREYNTFFQLAVIENGKQIGVEPCIVTDVQIDTVKNRVMHVDFMRVDPQQEVVRNVPVRATGRAAGVMKGGRIKTFRRTVAVAAKPADMPFEIVVDVTPLDIGESLRVRDIVLDRARLDEQPETMLALCETAKREVAAEGAPAAEGAAKPAAAAAAKPAAAKPAAKPAEKKK